MVAFGLLWVVTSVADPTSSGKRKPKKTCQDFYKISPRPSEYKVIRHKPLRSVQSLGLLQSVLLKRNGNGKQNNLNLMKIISSINSDILILQNPTVSYTWRGVCVKFQVELYNGFCGIRSLHVYMVCYCQGHPSMNTFKSFHQCQI